MYSIRGFQVRRVLYLSFTTPHFLDLIILLIVRILVRIETGLSPFPWPLSDIYKLEAGRTWIVDALSLLPGFRS
jgi:hypothetical protein